MQTGAVCGHSDEFGWDSLDPQLDPFAAGGVDDDYYITPGPGMRKETYLSIKSPNQPENETC